MIMGAMVSGIIVAEEMPLRDLDADRPDATESRRTLDAGCIQIEMSLQGYGRDRSGGVTSESFVWAETIWDDVDGDYHVDFLHTAVLGFGVTKRFGLYLEYLGVVGDSQYKAYASGGVTWAVTDRFQWDAGAVIGLNNEAEDPNTFNGFNVKF